MPKPLRNRISGFDAFFFFLSSRIAVINLLTEELMAFYTIKKKKKKKKERKEKMGLKISHGEFGIMKGLFWEGALIRGRSPRAAAGLRAGSPARCSAAPAQTGTDTAENGPPRPPGRACQRLAHPSPPQHCPGGRFHLAPRQSGELITQNYSNPGWPTAVTTDETSPADSNLLVSRRPGRFAIRARRKAQDIYPRSRGSSFKVFLSKPEGKNAI